MFISLSYFFSRTDYHKFPRHIIIKCHYFEIYNTEHYILLPMSDFRKILRQSGAAANFCFHVSTLD